MRRCQHRRILHVVLQVPKLLQSHPTDVDDVVALRYRCLGMFAVYGRTKGHDKACQRLVQGEQAQVLGRDFGRGQSGLGEVLFVGGDVLNIERRDAEEVDGNAASVASSEPLGILGVVLDVW
jgi:hypothetical protein